MREEEPCPKSKRFLTDLPLSAVLSALAQHVAEHGLTNAIKAIKAIKAVMEKIR